MIRIRPNKPLLLVLSVVLIGAPLFAETEGSLKLYPLPITELEGIIFNWLTHSGFEVRRTSLKMGQVQLNAVKAKENWQIFLKPRSPLATEVQARYSVGEQPDEARLQELWGYISRYTKGPSVEKWDAYQGIPTAVLSQIESVVCIRAKAKNEDIQLSGFIVDQDGLIICTAHDLKGVRDIRVVLYDGRELKGHLVKMDPRRDLALIDINLKSTTFISLAKGRNLLGMGERLYSVGCPVNLGGTVHPGIINGPPRLVNDLPLWQVNMQIQPGSSGSPVFDAQGNLVAIIKGRYRGTESVGFLIPFETIMEFVKE
jgi:serine protease Do